MRKVSIQINMCSIHVMTHCAHATSNMHLRRAAWSATTRSSIPVECQCKETEASAG
jgi:hypothetical protein